MGRTLRSSNFVSLRSWSQRETLDVMDATPPRLLFVLFHVFLCGLLAGTTMIVLSVLDGSPIERGVKELFVIGFSGTHIVITSVVAIPSTSKFPSARRICTLHAVVGFPVLLVFGALGVSLGFL